MPRSHTVQTGDSYSRISQKYYGNQRFLFQLMQANPGKARLHPGMTLDIPDFDVSPEAARRAFVPEALIPPQAPAAPEGLPPEKEAVRRRPRPPVQPPAAPAGRGVRGRRISPGVTGLEQPTPTRIPGPLTRPTRGGRRAPGIPHELPTFPPGAMDLEPLQAGFALPTLPGATQVAEFLKRPLFKFLGQQVTPEDLIPGLTYRWGGELYYWISKLPERLIYFPWVMGYGVTDQEIISRSGIPADRIPSPEQLQDPEMRAALGINDQTVRVGSMNFWLDMIRSEKRVPSVDPETGEKGYWVLKPGAEGGWMFLPATTVVGRQFDEDLVTAEGLPIPEWGVERIWDFDRMIRNPDGSIRWSVILGTEPYVSGEFIKQPFLDTLVDLTGATGLAATFGAWPERWDTFVEGVDADIPVRDLIISLEDPWREFVVNMATDPLNIMGLAAPKATARITAAIFPAGYLAGEVLSAITTAGARRTRDTLEVSRVFFRELYEKEIKSRSFFAQVAKLSQHSRYSARVDDAVRLIAMHYNPVTDPPALEFWQQVLLDPDHPGLSALRIGPNRRRQFLDAIALLKKAGGGALGMDDILKKYGAFTEVVTDVARGTVVEKVLEDASVEGIGRYLSQAVSDQYAKELGVRQPAKYSLVRALMWAGNFLVENFLGVNPRFWATNFMDNTVKSIAAGYAPPFDLTMHQKVGVWLGDEFGIVLPNEVVRSVIIDILDLERPLANSLLPWPWGTPEGFSEGLKNVWRAVFGRRPGGKLFDWLEGSSATSTFMRNFNYARLLRGGLNFSSAIEHSARANIFYSAFLADMEGRQIPLVFSHLRGLPDPPPGVDELYMALQNQWIKRPGDWDVFLDKYWPAPGILSPNVHPSDLAPPNFPRVEFRDDLQRVLNNLQDQWRGRWNDPGYRTALTDQFNVSRRNALDTWREAVDAYQEATELPEELLARLSGDDSILNILDDIPERPPVSPELWIPHDLRLGGQPISKTWIDLLTPSERTQVARLENLMDIGMGELADSYNMHVDEVLEYFGVKPRPIEPPTDYEKLLLIADDYLELKRLDWRDVDQVLMDHGLFDPDADDVTKFAKYLQALTESRPPPEVFALQPPPRERFFLEPFEPEEGFRAPAFELDDDLIRRQIAKALRGQMPDNPVIGAIFDELDVTDADSIRAVAQELTELAPGEIYDRALDAYSRLYREPRGLEPLRRAEPIVGRTLDVGGFRIRLPEIGPRRALEYNKGQIANVMDAMDQLGRAAIVWDKSTGRFAAGGMHEEALLELFPDTDLEILHQIANFPWEDVQENLMQLAMLDEATGRVLHFYSDFVPEMPRELAIALISAGMDQNTPVATMAWGGGRRAPAALLRELADAGTPKRALKYLVTMEGQRFNQGPVFDMILEEPNAKFGYHPQSGLVFLGDFEQMHPHEAMERFFPRREWLYVTKRGGTFQVVDGGVITDRGFRNQIREEAFVEFLYELGFDDDTLLEGVPLGNYTRLPPEYNLDDLLRVARQEDRFPTAVGALPGADDIEDTSMTIGEAIAYARYERGTVEVVVNKDGALALGIDSHHFALRNSTIRGRPEEFLADMRYSPMGRTLSVWTYSTDPEEILPALTKILDGGFPEETRVTLWMDFEQFNTEYMTLREIVDKLNQILDRPPSPPARPLPTRHVPAGVIEWDVNARRADIKLFRLKLSGQSVGDPMIGVFDYETGRLAWSTKLQFHAPILQHLELGVGQGTAWVYSPKGQLVVSVRSLGEAESFVNTMLHVGAPPDLPVKFVNPAPADDPEWTARFADAAMWNGTMGEFVGRGPVGHGTFMEELMQRQALLDQRRTNVNQATEMLNAILQGLDEWEQAAYRALDDEIIPRYISAQERKKAEAFVREGRARWVQALEDASFRATGEVHATLFDYVMKQRWEGILRQYGPFTTWQMRNPSFWAQALMDHPNVINWISHYYYASELERKKRNLTSRFEFTTGRPLEGVAGLPAGYYAVKPTNLVSLLSQVQEPFETPDWEPDQNMMARGLHGFIQAGRWLGINPWPWWQYLAEQVGAQPPASVSLSLGPQQRAIESILQEHGILEAGETLFGTTGVSEWLTNYYTNRRIVEMEAEGSIDHATALDAWNNPDHPVWQEAQRSAQQVQMMLGRTGMISPFQIKYASPGEIEIRRALDERQGLSPELRGWFTINHPYLETYSLLFGEDVELETARIYNKYDQVLRDLAPWEPEYRELVGQRATELEAVLGPQRPRDELIQSFMENPVVVGENDEFGRPYTEDSARRSVLFRLRDIEPRAGDYTNPVTQQIDWEAYNQQQELFLDNIDTISSQLGMPIELSEFIRFRYRYAAPEKVAYDLYNEWRGNAWDQYNLVRDVNAPGFIAMVGWAAEQQYLKDLSAGFTPLEASRLKAQNLRDWQREGLPVPYRNELTSDIQAEVPLGRFAEEIADILGIDLRDSARRYNLYLQLDHSLPGVFGEQGALQRATSGLYDYYYSITPGEQRRVRESFGLESFILDELSPHEVISMWARLLAVKDRPAVMQEGLLVYDTGRPGVPDLPIWDELTDNEAAELEQLRVDWYRYQRAREVGARGVWTELMEKYYSDPNSPTGQFWEQLNGVVLSTAAFDDPVIAPFLSRTSRLAIEYTDEQWIAAANYLRENIDRFIDPELTQVAREHPEWYELAQQQREELNRGKLDNLEALKSEYYGAVLGGSFREYQQKDAAWKRDNPEKWAMLEPYLDADKARGLGLTYYAYFYRHETYVKYYGDVPPDQIARSAPQVASDFQQALNDLDAYINGRSDEWTDLMQTFFGPRPETEGEIQSP